MRTATPRGHSNVKAGETSSFRNSRDIALIPISGGASLETYRPLPPLGLRQKEWEEIGRRMGWAKEPSQSSREKRLIEALEYARQVIVRMESFLARERLNPPWLKDTYQIIGDALA